MNEPTEELASLYVLDQLDAPARAAFEARLLREPELATLVRDLEAGFAGGVRALPQTRPSTELFDRIEAKIDAETPKARPETALHLSEDTPADASRWNPASGRVNSATTLPFPFPAFARWGIAAVIAVSLGILAVQSLRTARPTIIVVGLDANRTTFTELPLAGSTPDADARFMQLASLAENFWTKPGELPASVKPAAGDNRGYALFDPGSRQGFIAIEQLGAIAAHQRHHVWVVDPATHEVRDAGVLPASTANRGLYSFSLDKTIGAESARPHFFVTVEEENTSAPPAQPRGKVVLGSRSF